MQDLERRHPRVPAREVDDHIDAALEAAPVRLAERRIHPLHEVLFRVVDEVRGPQIFQPGELRLAARARDDVGAAKARELHAARADAAGRAEDQHFVARLHLADRVHHAHGGAVRDG